MSQANAWLLDLGKGYNVAVGVRELLHLIDMPVLYDVPRTPACCSRAVFWQAHLLPVMDLACRFHDASHELRFIGVVGYQQRKGESPQFGAVALAAPPVQITVSDEQACELPENMLARANLTVSCFEYGGNKVPVLNLYQLFGVAAEMQ